MGSRENPVSKDRERRRHGKRARDAGRSPGGEEGERRWTRDAGSARRGHGGTPGVRANELGSLQLP